MFGLSILIPVYKDDVRRQVALLQSQCKALEEAGLEWEIVVADDGSPKAFLEVNEAVNEMEGCRLISRGKNRGRSAMRNFLAREARHELLLYQDAETMPNDNLVSRYLAVADKADVVCGSFTVSEDAARNGNLRCRYELAGQRRLTAEKRNKQPYSCFHVNNFMARRNTVLSLPFDEQMRGYGYEDVMFGKQLEKNRVGVFHIDNPVAYSGFEDNASFLEKTARAIDTLYIYKDFLQGYSRILDLALTLERCHALWLPRLIMHLFSKQVLTNLKGHNPSLQLFNLYRTWLLTEKFLKD